MQHTAMRDQLRHKIRIAQKLHQTKYKKKICFNPHLYSLISVCKTNLCVFLYEFCANIKHVFLVFCTQIVKITPSRQCID